MTRDNGFLGMRYKDATIFNDNKNEKRYNKSIINATKRILLNLALKFPHNKLLQYQAACVWAF